MECQQDRRNFGRNSHRTQTGLFLSSLTGRYFPWKPSDKLLLILDGKASHFKKFWIMAFARPHKLPTVLLDSFELFIQLKPQGVKMFYVQCLYIDRVSQEECARFLENVPYVKVHRYNPKHLYPKLNGYGDNGQRKVWSSCGSTYCTC